MPDVNGASSSYVSTDLYNWLYLASIYKIPLALKPDPLSPHYYITMQLEFLCQNQSVPDAVKHGVSTVGYNKVAFVYQIMALISQM